MNILVTGGAGFIGSNLALKLVSRGHSVRVLDNLSPQIHGEDPDRSPLCLPIKGKVDFIRGDVCSGEDWVRSLDGVDTVVHLAAETGTGQSMYEIDRYCDVNVRGTAKMLDMIVAPGCPVKKCIVASSRAVYGEGKYRCAAHGTVYPKARLASRMSAGDFGAKCPVCGESAAPLPTDEDSLCQPNSIYGLTKYMQEKMVLMTGIGAGVRATALRFQNVYGPGQSLKNPYTGILSIFSTRLRNGNPVNIFEDGRESRDFVYIDDVVDSIVLCVEDETVSGEVFNVGTGVPVDVLTVAKTLAAKYGSTSNIEVSGNYRVGDIRTNFADISRIRERLGFSPKVSFNDGISRFTEWVDTQEIGADSFDRSMDEMRRKGLLK